MGLAWKTQLGGSADGGLACCALPWSFPAAQPPPAPERVGASDTRQGAAPGENRASLGLGSTRMVGPFGRVPREGEEALLCKTRFATEYVSFILSFPCIDSCLLGSPQDRSASQPGIPLRGRQSRGGKSGSAACISREAGESCTQVSFFDTAGLCMCLMEPGVGERAGGSCGKQRMVLRPFYLAHGNDFAVPRMPEQASFSFASCLAVPCHLWPCTCSPELIYLHSPRLALPGFITAGWVIKCALRRQTVFTHCNCQFSINNARGIMALWTISSSSSSQN